jgi:hypothetical protein
MLLVAFGLLLKPFDIIALVPVAIQTQRRWLSFTVAAGIGVARSLIAPSSDLYDASCAPRPFEELSWDMTLPVVMDAFPRLVWWRLRRWLNGLRRRQRAPQLQAL